MSDEPNAPRRAIGMVLPSSNRVVERVTRTIMRGMPDLDACFARVPYEGHPPGGYEERFFDAAAALLADARVDVICWNATRGALLGFDPDRRLCERIEAQTGLPAVTTALATLDLLKSRGLARIAMLVQGGDEEGARLAANFAAEGVDVAATLCLGISDNYEAALVPHGRIGRMVRQLASTWSPDAVLVWSTNLSGFEIADELEAGIGLPVLDSCAIGVLAPLAAIGVEPAIAERRREPA